MGLCPDTHACSLKSFKTNIQRLLPYVEFLTLKSQTPRIDGCDKSSLKITMTLNTFRMTWLIKSYFLLINVKSTHNNIRDIFVGYGNISPRSDWGKLVTILYAIIGMPLFLLYLSNIGDVLAKSFKWTYSKVCLCRICPGVAKRRLIRERRKLKQLAINRAVSNLW